LSTLLSDFNFLKVFQKNKNHYEFNPDTEKVIEIVPLYFSARSPSGDSYEMELPENVDTTAPRRSLSLFGAFLVNFEKNIFTIL
jgi:hypothetical protein